MKTIIAGSRSITFYNSVEDAIRLCSWRITEVVSGTAYGVDKLGERWAIYHNTPIKRFPANWDKLGRSAGLIRNKQMGDYADALIAIWDGKSRGTIHMITYMKSLGKPIFIHKVEL